MSSAVSVLFYLLRGVAGMIYDQRHENLTANASLQALVSNVIAIDDETAAGRHGAGVFLLGIWLA
jgi:hypothetical protein